jgi:hypothetical protein
MRVNRTFLYAGVFLVGVGGIVVAADVGALDTATIADSLRLWPVAVIAIGLWLALRRSRWSFSSGMLAAAVPGLLLGGAFAVAPRFVGACGTRGEPVTMAPQQGAFEGSANVSVRTGCGSLEVTTAPGSGWQLAGGNTAGKVPGVTSTGTSLSIESTGGHDWEALHAGRDSWTLTLPTSAIETLSFVANASQTHVTLPGAQIGQLALTANLSEIVVDASAASVTNLSGVVNLGRLSIELPGGNEIVGSLRIDGGQLQICTSPGAGLRVRTTGSARDVSVGGLDQTASDWLSPDYATAAHHADLDIKVNFGAVEINPIGGCR